MSDDASGWKFRTTGGVERTYTGFTTMSDGNKIDGAPGFAGYKGAYFARSTQKFDGHEFEYWQITPHAGLGFIVALDLAYRARRGDAGAAELLAAFGVTLVAADGRRYWPMDEGDKPVVVSHHP